MTMRMGWAVFPEGKCRNHRHSVRVLRRPRWNGHKHRKRGGRSACCDWYRTSTQSSNGTQRKQTKMRLCSSSRDKSGIAFWWMRAQFAWSALILTLLVIRVRKWTSVPRIETTSWSSYGVRPVGSMSGCAMEKSWRGRLIRHQRWKLKTVMMWTKWPVLPEIGAAKEAVCVVGTNMTALLQKKTSVVYFMLISFCQVGQVPRMLMNLHLCWLMKSLLYHVKNHILAYKVFFGRIHFTYFYCLRMHQDSWCYSLFWLQFFNLCSLSCSWL